MVTALKNISEGNALEDYMDIDNLLRYMAVHVFFVNEDSLSGSMAHNYYLYESGGENRDTADTPQQTEEDTPNRGGNFEGRPSMDGFPRHIRKRIPGCIHRYADPVWNIPAGFRRSPVLCMPVPQKTEKAISSPYVPLVNANTASPYRTEHSKGRRFCYGRFTAESRTAAGIRWALSGHSSGTRGKSGSGEEKPR